MYRNKKKYIYIEDDYITHDDYHLDNDDDDDDDLDSDDDENNNDNNHDNCYNPCHDDVKRAIYTISAQL